MSERLALIIGNSEFEDSTLARLVTPGRDASELAEILKDPAIGHFDEVMSLINEPAPVVRRAVARFFARRNRSDLLLLYFSGHGVLDDQGLLYLAVKDTERDLLRATGIAASFITQEMDRSRSRRQVLILDCCHSGAFARGAKGVPGTSVGTANSFKGTGLGRVVITASDATQYAWEGDQVIGEVETSLFTRFMIQGLRTGAADTSGDGLVSIDEMYDYVYDQVLDKTSKQTPSKWSYKQQGEIVIARNPRWAELQRLAAEKAEAERKAAEEAKREAEAERLAAEREAARRAAVQAEVERLMAQQAEEERKAQHKTEAEQPVTDQAEPKPVRKPPTVFVPTPEREKAKVHPYVSEARDLLRKGRISRRQFIYIATLLGVPAAIAVAWAVFRPSDSTPESPRPTATTAMLDGAAAPTATETAGGAAASVGNIKRGGTFTSAMHVMHIDHPARFSWVEDSNVVRQVGEYLTETNANNITRPRLLERWETSDDLKTWTLRLRQGVKFNNGDELTADDVMFTFGEWLNPEVGSSMLSRIGDLLGGMQDVEKVDDYTIRLHLSTPDIAVPEYLFHFPAVILHRSFGGDFIKQPTGTGAFTLEEYAVGERAVLKRREDYWRAGADGQPLPYLDEIIYVELGDDSAAAVAAMQSRQIDSMYEPGPNDWLVLKDVAGLTIRSARTSKATVLRMRVDHEPWDDVRVRNALKMCQDREKILQSAYFGEGDLAIDAHVAPFHLGYCQKPIPKYDPEQARALLAEAGYSDGLDVSISVGTGWPEVVAYAESLREDAKAAGIDLTLERMTDSDYWNIWSETSLGITPWTHHPLSTMALSLAYNADSEGNPVPWNETRWVDEEFIELLRQAKGEVDVAAREKIMCRIEDIMQDRGPIGISYWKKVWNVTRSEFKNIKAHASSYDLLYDVWKDA
jgi:peptide/nickel transport system substrate-binding protein